MQVSISLTVSTSLPSHWIRVHTLTDISESYWLVGILSSGVHVEISFKFSSPDINIVHFICGSFQSSSAQT